MCGIAGIISASPEWFSPHDVKKMTDALAHRGPDGECIWSNSKGNAILGHRRLAIIDLSDAAAQPMHYLGRYTIVHNGEIYNYIELRNELSQKGYSFHTESDTEVILAAYDCWKEYCTSRLDGMFAFAIWDEKEQELFAARDRFGEKPFYYCVDHRDGILYFASECKALFTKLPRSINEKMVLNFIGTGNNGNPSDARETFFTSVNRLPPATYLKFFPPNTAIGIRHASIHAYWSIDKDAQIDMDEGEALGKIKHFFFESVRKRYRSDTPVGTSLSGGLDSSSIVAASYMLKAPSDSHKCFTVCFPSFQKDECLLAQEVATKFNLQHFRVLLGEEDFINDFERLMYYQEEPISSASVYAQFKVFELAKQHGVKVLLDGQGADETLAGYHKYIHWYLQELFRGKRHAMNGELGSLKENRISFPWGWKNYLAAWFPGLAAQHLEKREVKKILHHPEITDEFKNEYFDRGTIHKPMVKKLNDILYYNTCQAGLEELLRYADRNSMAHGREVRLPFLSYELVEFIFSLPSSFKIRNGWTKWLLRKSMADSLPEKIVWRTDKVGFEPPQEQWMKNKSVQELIYHAKQKLVKEKMLKPEVLQKKIMPRAAYQPDNFDWRYLVTAHLL